MKVIKSTGLVPVIGLVAVDYRPAGDIFGVTPEMAAKMVSAGDAKLADIPKGVETEEYAIPIPVAPEDPAAAGEPVAKGKGGRKPKPKPVAPEDPEPPAPPAPPPPGAD